MSRGLSLVRFRGWNKGTRIGCYDCKTGWRDAYPTSREAGEAGCESVSVVFAAILAWDADAGLVVAVRSARFPHSSDPLADGVSDWAHNAV